MKHITLERVAIFIVILVFVFLAGLGIHSIDEAYDELEKVTSEDYLKVPCKDWPIATDGKHFRFKYPDSDVVTMFDYNSREKAAAAACRQLKYELDKQARTWTEVK